MKNEQIKKKLLKLGALVFLVYFFFLVGKTVYQNIQFNSIEKDLEKEVDLLEAENANLKNKILYYKTDSYKERVMRERLGYQKPGEQVLSIVPEKEGEETKKEEEVQLSNYEKWKKFLFPEKKDS